MIRTGDDLVSRLYDGTMVRTPHPGWERNSTSAQAREHRRRVRSLLTRGRIARLLPNDPPPSP